MQEYTIIDRPFTKSDCYKSKKKTARTGIQVHSVGSKGTLVARWEKSWNRPGRTVCANYVIDVEGIYRLLRDDQRCWLSGSGENGNANDTHLGFEICEPLTRLDTPEVAADLYGKVLYLCVYWCRMHHINPAYIQAHYELHALGLASNHADVRHWWGRKGKSWEQYTMDRLRADVAKELGVEMEYTTAIKRGSSGAAVVYLQKVLAACGYTLDADGDFGALTEAALIAYQRKHKLAADGVCGAKTWAVIYAENHEAVTDAEADTIETDATGETQTKATLPMLRRGLRGENVRTLQTALNAAGATLAIDGVFGKITEAALKAYQAANGLVVDGVCGPETWEKINA